MRQFPVLFALLLTACTTRTADVTGPDTILLDELTITDIHDAYRAGNYTSEDLVTAYLARMDSLNDPLNAISNVNPQALEDARQLDREFAETGRLRPLHGIPLLIKDNINTVGMPTTAGARALQDFMPATDAFAIEKLREAGAILIAKTNMAEWAFSAKHTESSTVGTTHNPYGVDYVPAGSSGGTAAGVAANFALGGLGTDTGNSIRGPSSHTALVGLRTTLGLISREGIVPLYLRNDVVGPMCRTVEDATRVMQAMVGVDAADPLTTNSEGRAETDYLQYLNSNGLQNARIGVLRELSEADPDPRVTEIFNQAITDLERLGATVVDPFVIPNFAQLRRDQWCETFRADVEDFLGTYVKNDTVSTLEDIVRIGTNSEDTRENLAFSLSKTGRYGDSPEPCGDAYTDARRIAFREAIEAAMDSLQLDAIVYPSWNHPPARIDNWDAGYRGDNSQVICPHTGQPGFTVPMGFVGGEGLREKGKEGLKGGGLPAGLQFLGRMYDEPTLIRLCYGYERGTLHRRAPSASGLK